MADPRWRTNIVVYEPIYLKLVIWVFEDNDYVVFEIWKLEIADPRWWIGIVIIEVHYNLENSMW